MRDEIGTLSPVWSTIIGSGLTLLRGRYFLTPMPPLRRGHTAEANKAEVESLNRAFEARAAQQCRQVYFYHLSTTIHSTLTGDR